MWFPLVWISPEQPTSFSKKTFVPLRVAPHRMKNGGGPRSVVAKVATDDGGHPRDPPPKPNFQESHSCRRAAHSRMKMLEGRVPRGRRGRQKPSASRSSALQKPHFQRRPKSVREGLRSLDRACARAARAGFRLCPWHPNRSDRLPSPATCRGVTGKVTRMSI